MTASGDVVDVRPLGEALKGTGNSTLIKGDNFEVLRLVLVAGKEVGQHQAAGEITVQCLEGRVEFEAHGHTRTLLAGDLIFLAAAVPHALRAIHDSSILLTRQRKASN